MAAASALLLALPPAPAAWAKRGSIQTSQAMPAEIKTEGNMDEVWDAIDIGESKLADPNDAKWAKKRLDEELGKAKKRNEDYDAMSKEDKTRKMCDLLGKMCDQVDFD